MKRMTLWAVAAGLCLLMAAPAMALDVDFSGQYRVRGFYIDKENMGNTRDGSGNATPDQYDRSYMDMRFRLQTIFKVNENISVTTRMDALDNTYWGDRLPGYKGNYALYGTSTSTTSKVTSDPYPNDQPNVHFDRAYATIKTPIGGFLFGRMKDASWGTPIGDTEGNGDRLAYVVPIKNWIFAAVYEKWHEIDSDKNNQVTFAQYASTYGSDQDNDKYYLSATYRSESFTTGLLYGYYKVGNYMDVGDEDHYQAVTTTLGTSSSTAVLRRPIKATANLLSPYFVGQWGDFELQAEATYAWGSGDYTYQDGQLTALGVPAAAEAAIRNSMKNGGQDKDLEFSQFMVDGTYHLGPLSFNVGYAFQSGGVKYRSTNGDKATAFGIIEQSGDWHKMWILNGGNSNMDDNGLYKSLGGGWNPVSGVGATSYDEMGNLSNFQSTTSINGFRSYWFGLDYAIMDNMSIGGLVGQSQADQVMNVPGGPSWEKDHGTEFDVNFIWDVYQNLTWQITYAYLKAGDYWKAGDVNRELKDPYTFYTNVAVNF